MLTVEFHDKLFEGYSSAARGDLKCKPKHIFFDRTANHSIALFTDESLDEVNSSKAVINLAWLVESPDFKKNIYKKMRKKKVYSKFDRIYTFDSALLAKDPRFVMLPVGGSWIDDKNWRIYNKYLNLSMIASRKKQLKGHRLRHEIIGKFADYLDEVYGSGYLAFDNKIDVMKPFRYSIVIENGRRDYYFTEKLIDCFAVGTIPIYWGCPSIGKFFNPEGILPFRTLRDLKKILANISEEDYFSRMAAVKDNLARAKDYVMPEDNMYELMKRDQLFSTELT